MPLKAGKGDTWSYLRVCFPGLPKDLMGVLEDDNQSPGPFRSEIQWNKATFSFQNQDICPVRNGGLPPWAARFPFNEGIPLVFQCQGVLNSYWISLNEDFLSFRESEMTHELRLYIFEFFWWIGVTLKKANFYEENGISLGGGKLIFSENWHHLAPFQHQITSL